MFFYLKASAKDIRVLEKFSQFLNKLDTSTFMLKHRSKQNQRKLHDKDEQPFSPRTTAEQLRS